MISWSRMFSRCIGQRPSNLLSRFRLALTIPRYRNCVLTALGSCFFLLGFLYSIEYHLHQTTYTDYQERLITPRDGIITGRQEKVVVEELYQATQHLLKILHRGHREKTKISVILKDLTPYLSPEESITSLPYETESRKEVIHMYNSARLLYDKATKDGVESEYVDELNYQLKVLRLREFPDKTWSDSCDGCMKYTFKRLISPKGVCSGGGEVEFVNLITSVPGNIKERMAIRETWGIHDENKLGKIRMVFLFGAGWSEEQNNILKMENERYGDILQDDFKDGYYNLTYKVLMGYKWVRSDCSHARFVMRAADDAYVNVPRVLELLQQNGDTDNFQKHQVGLCFKSFKPYRHYDYKGYVSYTEYPSERFPAYALGTNFLTSQKLTQEILKASENVPFMCIEDAYIGLVLQKINRGCHNILSFVAHTPKKEKKPLYIYHCNYLYWYTYHPLDADMMYKIHNNCSIFSYKLFLNSAFYIVSVLLILVVYMIVRPKH